ncbi:MAG: UpxY family transcription antiterminator [Bacteroidetes bacterium]|nr:UpxY family transcription antiterminator [Candidatus Colenecus caballi]
MPLFPVGTEIPTLYAKPQWFVGCVRYCHEHKAADMLSHLNVEHYLPVQIVRRRWSDRMKNVEVLLIPRYIFIRCKYSERVEILENVPDITHFLVDRDTHKSATVREESMNIFRRMVEYDDREITVEPGLFAPGDHVRVIHGPLAGSECDLVEVNGRKCIAVNLGMLGAARMEMPLSQIELIK